MKLRYLFGSLLLSITAAVAQDAPPAAKLAIHKASAPVKTKDTRTLDDTFQWVKQQIDSSSGSSYQVTYLDKGYEWHHTNSYVNLQMADCQMVIDQVFRNNQRPENHLKYTVPLWDIASADYELNHGTKQFKYTPAVPALFLHSRNSQFHWTKPKTFYPTKLVEIQFGRDPNFTRAKIVQLGNAFMHLQELCAPMAPATPAANPAPAASPKASQSQ